jgi:hypothetical protein
MITFPPALPLVLAKKKPQPILELSPECCRKRRTGSSLRSVSENPSLPKLNLTAAQREQVRQALLTKHTEVEFRLKATKSAKDFTPKIGAKLPKGVKPDGLPSELTQKIPQLADYGYAKMKDQILIE